MVNRNRTRISSFGLVVRIFELELSCQEGALTQVITARCPYRYTLHHGGRRLYFSSSRSTSRGTWKWRWRITTRPARLGSSSTGGLLSCRTMRRMLRSCSSRAKTVRWMPDEMGIRLTVMSFTPSSEANGND